MSPRTILILAAVSIALAGCTKTDEPRAGTDEITEIALSDIPQNVRDLVAAKRPDFKTTEVLKKVRDGRVYYDVEGELPDGKEIEFDILMTVNGPEIVEIQRDLPWNTVPAMARNVVDKANTDNLEIVRIIESVQTDSSIIYEVFVADHPSDPRFEVHVKDGTAKLLAARWEH